MAFFGFYNSGPLGLTGVGLFFVVYEGHEAVRYAETQARAGFFAENE